MSTYVASYICNNISCNILAFCNNYSNSIRIGGASLAMEKGKKNGSYLSSNHGASDNHNNTAIDTLKTK